MKWVVYDPVDKCWIGSNDAGDGPRLYDERWVARVASETYDVMMGYQRRRCVEVEFDAPPLKLKDRVTPKMSVDKALDLMEKGAVL